MRKESTGSRSESRPEWEQLEDWVRSQVQRLIPGVAGGGGERRRESAIPRSSSRVGCCAVRHRTRKIAELIPELYLHGLSEGDFDLALRGCWERTHRYRPSTVAR